MEFEIIGKNDFTKLKEYESFVCGHKNGTFFQSLDWTKVKDNWKSEIVTVRAGGRITGAALILIKKLPLGKRTMLYSPHGPVCDYNDKETVSKLMEAVRHVAALNNSCMYRIDPPIEHNDIKSIEDFSSYGFRYTARQDDSYTTIQTKNNYILEINKRTADEVFEAFHPKWRYNIRLAERKGVVCTYAGEEDLDEAHRLMLITGERDNFSVRSKEYYKKMLDAFGERCRLYVCKKDGEMLSAAIAINYAERTSYVYGASSNSHRNLMPNYLMQWSMIKWAIKTGCRIYDFMGIPFYYDETHPNYGVYRFKKGFGGRVLTYAGEFDCIYRPFTAALLRSYLGNRNKAFGFAAKILGSQ